MPKFLIALANSTQDKKENALSKKTKFFFPRGWTRACSKTVYKRFDNGEQVRPAANTGLAKILFCGVDI
ncbi:MAG: hypothetical protein COZ21_08250 [Bacteroidetes bacterium CG_4_10_14_3_um_filter_31_20]|nr:MAG: hypothetical protein COZ21_08250 [Bacteroidetes bacterium CG_4_10_14_3_um_filter_31_20]